MQQKLIISFLIVILSGLISKGQEVKVGGLFPKKAHSGTDIIVSFTIEKGDLNDFARFQIEVPQGISPTPRISRNAEFSFDNNIVKLVWVKMPIDGRFDISITFRISPNTEGYKVFKGELSYVDKKGNSKSIEMEPQIVEVEKDEFATNITQELEFNYKYFTQKGVTCIRQKPYIDSLNRVVVNIMVSKGELDEFGRIEETVPYGYRAENLKSAGAIFAFNNQRRQVKFIWMNLPNSEKFTISYVLIPTEPTDEIPFILSGSFMFAENRITHSIPITELNMELNN